GGRAGSLLPLRQLLDVGLEPPRELLELLLPDREPGLELLDLVAPRCKLTRLVAGLGQTTRAILELRRLCLQPLLETRQLFLARAQDGILLGRRPLQLFRAAGEPLLEVAQRAAALGLGLVELANPRLYRNRA